MLQPLKPLDQEKRQLTRERHLQVATYRHAYHYIYIYIYTYRFNPRGKATPELLLLLEEHSRLQMQTSNAINLSGSVATVTEYLGFAINSILYQRGIYPPDDFQKVSKYGLTLMISNDEDLNAYLAELLQQIAAWIARGECRRLVLLITNLDTNATLERWEFNIDTEAPQRQSRPKAVEDVRREVQAVMRQITSSVSFLPVIEHVCAFDLLVYTSVDAQVPPSAWEPSDPQVLKGGMEVKLRSFTTNFHQVDTSVMYRD